MTGLSLAVLFCLIGPTLGQLCDPNKERIDCGYRGTVNKTQCLARGCCWNSDIKQGVPFCFMNTTKSCEIKGPRVDCNQLHEKDRIRGTFPHNLDNNDHGDYIDCVRRGCCWSPSDTKDEPWCFFPERNCNSTEPKTDCGHTGITQVQCMLRGCCWKPTDDIGEHWCFFTGRNCKPSEPRIDCGYINIDKENCMVRGCCWGPTEAEGQPWCYMPSNAD